MRRIEVEGIDSSGKELRHHVSSKLGLRGATYRVGRPSVAQAGENVDNSLVV